MYAPNSIHGRLRRRNEDEASISTLLKEVNETLENLNSWKEQEKRLDAEFDSQLQERREVQSDVIDEVPENLDNVDIKELDLEKLKHKQIDMIEVKNTHIAPLRTSSSNYNIQSADIYEVGTKLNELLTD